MGAACHPPEAEAMPTTTDDEYSDGRKEDEEALPLHLIANIHNENFIPTSGNDYCRLGRR